MKHLLFSTLTAIAISLTSIAQSPMFTANSNSYHETVDIKAYDEFVYVLGTFGNSTTFNSGLIINAGSIDRSYYLACYEALSGNLKWVNYAYGDPANQPDFYNQAVDLEVSANGEIMVLFESMVSGAGGAPIPGLPTITCSNQVRTVDAGGALISTAVVTSTPASGNFEQPYFISSLEPSGVIQNTGQVRNTMSFQFNVKLRTIETKSGGEAWLGGRLSSSPFDAFIGEYHFNGTYYDVTANRTLNSLVTGFNVVNDLALAPSTDELVAIGTYTDANIMFSGLPAPSANDAFTVVLEANNLTTTLAQLAGGAVSFANGKSVAVQENLLNTNQLDIAVAGDFRGNMITYGPLANSVPNAFVTKLTYASSTLTHDWSYKLDDPMVSQATGNGVTISNNSITAVGEFIGPFFNVASLGCGQTGTLGAWNGWMAGFHIPTASCTYAGSLDNFTTGGNFTQVAVAAVQGFPVSAGLYTDEFNTQPAATPNFVHPNPSLGEHYVTRFDATGGNQYFKTDATTSIANATEKELTYSVFPNPASDAIQLIGEVDEPIHVQVFTVDGQLVLETVTNTNSRIDVAQLNAGLYMLRLNNAETISISIH